MANIFCDQGLASGSNNGTDMDNAYYDIGGLNRTFTGENYVWVRRRSSYTLAANCTIAGTSTRQNKNPKVIAWPRASLAFTGTWTQGERVISSVSGITPKLQQHAARYAKNDTDGNYYLITAIAVKIVFSAVTQAFAKYEKITASGGAIGKIMRWDSGSSTAWIVVKSGTFASAETVTGDGRVQENVSKTAGAGTIDTVATDGFVIIQDYAGTSEMGGNSTIKEDDFYAIAQAIDDSAWTIKKTDWDADPHDLPVIDGGSTTYHLSISAYYVRLSCFNLTGGGTATSFLIDTKFGTWMNGCIFQNINNVPAVNFGGGFGGHLTSSIVIGTGNSSNSSDRGIRSLSATSRIVNSAIYNFGNYGAELLAGIGAIENSNFGVELDNASYDIQNQGGQIIGFDIQCGGKAGALRSSTYDDTRVYTAIHNWQRVLGNNTKKISNGKIDVVAIGSDPGTPPSGLSSVYRFSCASSCDSGDYVPQHDDIAVTMQEIPLSLASGTHTIRLYLQNNGFGNLNASDAVDTADIWFDVIAAEQRVSDSLYYTSRSSSPNLYKRSTSSSNPITNRSAAGDWTAYLQSSITIGSAQLVLIRLRARKYSAAGILYIDPKVAVS